MRKTRVLLAVLLLSGCERLHKTTQADVDAFIAERDMLHEVNEWRRDLEFRRWQHPDGPMPLPFSNVDVADPIMWDYTEHAVLRGGHRVWYWSNDLPQYVQ